MCVGITGTHTVGDGQYLGQYQWVSGSSRGRPELPVCKACRIPQVPHDTLAGDNITYSCIEGYSFVDGSAEVTVSCQDDGLWGNVTMECMGECTMQTTNMLHWLKHCAHTGVVFGSQSLHQSSTCYTDPHFVIFCGFF